MIDRRPHARLAAPGARLDRRRSRRVRELREALLRAPLGPPVLAAHISDLRSALEADLALSYGVLDAGDHLELDFMHAAGERDLAAARTTFGTWLRGLRAKSGWAAYNPVLPESAQRNRLFSATSTSRRRPRNATPVVRELYPLLGLDGHDCVRTLICEGPSLLAWVGVYQHGPIAPWQRTAFRALIPPLSARLIADRRFERYRATRNALEVVLEATACAAFILSERGAVEAGNGLARAALRAGRERTVETLRASLRAGAPASGYAITALGDGQYLALERAPSGSSHHTRLVAAKTRFGLSERQAEVLELLLHGASGPEVARRLGIARSTLEKHMAALYERVGVSQRGALIARVTAL